jgi:hypothetical protein
MAGPFESIQDPSSINLGVRLHETWGLAYASEAQAASGARLCMPAEPLPSTTKSFPVDHEGGIACSDVLVEHVLLNVSHALGSERIWVAQPCRN